VIDALKANEGADASELYIFCDGHKTAEDQRAVSDVRKVLEDLSWKGDKHLHFSEVNKGINDSVTQGMDLVFKKHDRAIIIEDDIVCSSGFLKFINEALEFYEHEERVKGVTGYAFFSPEKLPASYFLPIGSCWGWGTWRRVWQELSFDGPVLKDRIRKKGIDDFNFGHYPYFQMLDCVEIGKAASWDVCLYSNCFLDDGLFLFPNHSLVQNIGFDASGTHSNTPDSLQVVNLVDKIAITKILVELDQVVVNKVKRYFERDFKPSFLGGVKRKILSYLKGSA